MGQKTNPLILRSNLKSYECGFKYLEKNYEESTVLFYKFDSLQSYIERVFILHGLLIHSLKIEYSINFVKVTVLICDRNVRISKLKKTSDNELTNYLLLLKLVESHILLVLNKYFKTSLDIKIKFQNVNKKFESNVYKSKKIVEEYKKIIKSFRKFLKIPLIKELFIVNCVAIFEKKSAQLLAKHISIYYSNNKKRHNYLLVFLKKSLLSLINSPLSKVSGLKIKIKGRFNGAPRSKINTVQIGSVPLQSFKFSVDYAEHVAYTTNGTFGIKVWICYKT